MTGAGSALARAEQNERRGPSEARTGLRLRHPYERSGLARGRRFFLAFVLESAVVKRSFSLGLAVLLSSSIVSAQALAEVQKPEVSSVEVPAQGGAPALSVSVSKTERLVRFGKEPNATTPVDMPFGKGARVEVSAVAVGQGKKIAHVVVTEGDARWEGLFAPGAEAPLFAGKTGYFKGNEGEREGASVKLVDKSDGTKTVIVADIREDSRICGESATDLRPRVLDPKTLTLRGATIQRLSAEARASAKKLVPTALATAPAAPRAKLFSSGGESGARGLGKNLIDERPETAWLEERPGIGQGEFVTLRTPRELGIERLVFTVTPTNAPAKYAAPSTLFLVTPGEVRELQLPDDVSSKPGGAYEVKLAVPLRTECLSLVLGDAYALGMEGPEVGLAEVSAYSSLESKPVDEVVKSLGAPGETGDAAAAFLKRTGAYGLEAIAKVYSALDGVSRARAVDVATAAPSCDAAAEVLLLGVVDTEAQASKKARDRLERCGKGASRALAAGLTSKDAKLRAVSAELYGLVAPREALGPLAEAAGRGERAERAAVRAALAKASRNAEPEALERLLSGAKEAKTKVELLRGLAARLAEVPQAEALVTRELSSPEMGTRYILVEPARALGLAGKIAPLSSLLDDADPYVRAHAAESSERIPTLAPKLTQKLADPDPRVREAALVSLAASKVTPERETMAVFANDEWTFVRVAAAGALAQLPPGREAANPVDKALEAGLAERSPLVKQAALAALGQRHAKGSAAAIAEVAKDAEAPLEVRVTATRTLGAVCASSELEYLTRAAKRALSPLDEADLRVGVAAIDALGRLHPADLATRLSKLREKGVRPPLVNAANRALVETDVCKVQ